MITTYLVIKIGNRYFREFKNGRCITAWSILGAKSFFDSMMLSKALNDVVSKLEKKGKKYTIVRVEIKEVETLNPQHTT
jgi:hypothetical protein